MSITPLSLKAIHNQSELGKDYEEENSFGD
jgi:hypothetical protein